MLKTKNFNHERKRCSMRKQKQLAKKLMGFLLTLVMICTLIPLAPQTVKAASDGFYISGTSVYDANGNKFVGNCETRDARSQT